MKYFNIKRNKFSAVLKNINFRRYNFLRTFKLVDFKKFNFSKAYKYLYTYIKEFDFYKKNKKNIFFYLKNSLAYFFYSVVFIGFIYLIIPVFYSYDKSKIEKIICKNKNIDCAIKGKVKYSFYPTPRIKIKDLTINLKDKKNTLLKANNVAIELSFKNLLNKKKQNFKKIKLNNFSANIDLKNLKKYKNIFLKDVSYIPLELEKGNFIFLDKKNTIAGINDLKLDLKFQEDSIDAILRGKFLNEKVYIDLSSKKINDIASTDIILKVSKFNLLAKTNYINSKNDQNLTNGNFLIKKDKHRFVGAFDYKNNELSIKESNLKNVFFNGNLEGKIKFFPYFDFDLDLGLKSLNFTKLYNYFLSLEETKQKNLFKINNKINGKLALSSDKLYTRYDLVKSFESRLKFNNGNISVDQFLLNLGKLGAADISGNISNDKKFTSLKYESNLFVDNQKKFLSKLEIYNKKNISPNFFVSGNFDFQNIKSTFYEISDNEKLKNEDINFIEEEFNALMLTDGYKNLFHFPKFVEFIKAVTSETN